MVNSFQYRAGHSCNIQADSAVYWSSKGDYSELFQKCPLKDNDLRVKIN